MSRWLTFNDCEAILEARFGVVVRDVGVLAIGDEMVNSTVWVVRSSPYKLSKPE